MTAEAQQIAIAETCGWDCSEILEGEDGLLFARKGGDWDILPDYLNDLNAMHEAEKILDYEEAEQYASALQAIIINAELFMDNPPPSNFACLTATAAQRCEAFLKTIKKWTYDN